MAPTRQPLLYRMLKFRMPSKLTRWQLLMQSDGNREKFSYECHKNCRVVNIYGNDVAIYFRNKIAICGNEAAAA